MHGSGETESETIRPQFDRFLICSGEPVRLPQHSSSRLRSFFKTNQFRTGYATHGVFPYRGKFHPQMIRRNKGIAIRDEKRKGVLCR